MTSEIRANTLKNRVGLGTVSFTNTGPVVSGIVTANTFRLPDATSGSLGRLQIGNGLDLSLFHNGIHSYLQNSTGSLFVLGDALKLRDANGVDAYIECFKDGAVNISYNDSIKIQTTNTGAVVTGILTATTFVGNGDFVELDVDGHTNLDNVSIAGVTTFSEDTKFIGATSGRDLQWDKSDNTLEFLDYTAAKFGTDNNLTIYHNSGNNNSYISENGVGSLLIQATDLYLTNTAGQNHVICATGGRVQLNFNGNDKLQTTNTGIKLTSGVASGGGISNMLQLDNTGNNNGDGGKITFSRAGTIRTEIEALKNETANNETDIVFRTTNAGSLGEKLRITSDGLIQTKARSAGVRRMILSGSPTNTAFNIEAHDGATGTSANTNQGELGLYYNDGSTLTDEAVIKFYRGSGAGDGYFGFNTGSTEKLRIVADGKLMTSATGYIYTSSSAGSLTLYGGNTNKGGGIILSGGNSPSTGDIRFYAQMSQSSPAERLRITSGGDTELRNIVSGITNSYSQYLKFRTTQTNNQSAVTGQIAAQGTSSWGGELVFYTKPANGSPNDTVTERVRIHDNGQLDNLSTSAINTKFKTSNSNGSYNIYEMGNSGASLGFIGSGTQLATGGGATDFCIRAQSGGLKLCTSGADVRAYIQSSSFKEIVFPQQSNDTFAQRVYRTTVSGVTAQAYTKFATVSGTDLSSHIKMTTHTTIGSVVCSQDWDIKAGHSHDFFVTSTSLAYTESKIKIISNGNQNYDLYLQRSGGANQADGATYRVVIHPMCQESVTFNSTVNYSTVTHEHSSSQGARKITASGGVGGNFIMPGTITKGGGTFTIPHPLASKKDTHKLSHSFIEGPQMDLIYRGKTTLVAGISTVNIDTNSNMTEGTFVLLNRDVQCFTTNETGWTNIKGSVTGNKITIIAQDNSCTDTISWMVVGERQDDTAKSLNMTDDDGNLIVEPAIEEDVDRSSLQELYPTL